VDWPCVVWLVDWLVSEVVVWLTEIPASAAQKAPPTPAAAVHCHNLLVHVRCIVSPLECHRCCFDCAGQSLGNSAGPTACILRAHRPIAGLPLATATIKHTEMRSMPPRIAGGDWI